jgi:tetratricopeptide (TPR) repeat protein
LALTPLSQKNQLLIDRASARIPGGGRLMRGLYEALVWERFLRLPSPYRKRLEPFVRHSGISKKRLWLALFQPDMLMVLAATASPRTRNHFLQGLPGCSTVRVFTPEGAKFIRNLDYPAASHWERFPTVCYHEPSEAGLLKHVSVTSLGIPSSGLTGWNEAGVAISLHAHFSKRVSFKGVPIFFLGEDILESARNLDEAIELCKTFKPIGSWALNLSSFKENRHVTVELVAGKIHVREADRTTGIAHSNHFQSPDFKRDELGFCADFQHDCVARKSALELLAGNHASQFNWKEALLELSNHRDSGSGELRVYGNTASVITTIQTVGFDPVSDSIYLSIRNETPVTHGPYLILPRDPERLSAGSPPELLDLGQPHPEAFMKALHHFHQAYVSWQVRGDRPEVTHALLLQAVEAWPKDPHLLMQLGYFELIAGQARDAQQHFQRALSIQSLSSHHRDLCHYFKGAALDILGNRDEAIRCYQTVTGRADTDPALQNKAKRRLNRPYTRKHTQQIEPDLQFVEPLNYP